MSEKPGGYRKLGPNVRYATYRDLTARIVLISVEESKVSRPDIWIGTIEISWSEEKTPTVFRPAFTVVYNLGDEPRRVP
jgi:hypothetical protein